MDALLAMLEHGLHHVGVALGLQHIEQGMEGTIGVPKREDGVVGEAFGLMDVMVDAAVLSVHIHIDGGIDHGVIE